jgi:integrase
MKIDRLPQTTTPVTLQTVVDRLAAHPELTTSRRRDLRSAVISFAKLTDQSPAAVVLNLDEIRKTLDAIVPARAKISRKRWANIRSDLAAAIDASGLRPPMLKTGEIELDEPWRLLLANADQRSARGLSRFARWASLRQVAPQAVDEGAVERFVRELGDATLVRNLRYARSFVATRWNELVASGRVSGLRPVAVEGSGRVLRRIPWQSLPACFRDDVAQYTQWASMPEPLAEGARVRALGPRSLRLQQEHIHSAASAAVAAGMSVGQLTSLAILVQPGTFRAVLGHLWQHDGRKVSAYSVGIGTTLTAIAVEWVRAPADQVATLKALRSKLGRLPSGLTVKNQATLRTFADPRLVADLVRLPDRVWRQARRALPKSKRAFLELQSAVAIDVLLHVPVRMQNLSSINFDTHLHWPQGPRKPALITFRRQETKNDVTLEFELPTALADRLQTFRNEIAPAVIGRKPDTLFVTGEGKPRSQAAVAIAIHKTILRQLGVSMTPHQFRHLCAKLILDRNPGAYELVRQMLGHTTQKTAAHFYAGIDTLRAGRAHAELVNALRESKLSRDRHRRSRRPEE